MSRRDRDPETEGENQTDRGRESQAARDKSCEPPGRGAGRRDRQQPPRNETSETAGPRKPLQTLGAKAPRGHMEDTHLWAEQVKQRVQGGHPAFTGTASWGSTEMGWE